MKRSLKLVSAEAHARKFVDDYIYPNAEGKSLPAAVIYELYLKQADEDHLKQALTMTRFSRVMREFGYDKGARPVPSLLSSRRCNCFLRCHISITLKAQYEQQLVKYIDSLLDQSYKDAGLTE